jgi:hypothetical protein
LNGDGENAEHGTQRPSSEVAENHADWRELCVVRVSHEECLTKTLASVIWAGQNEIEAIPGDRAGLFNAEGTESTAKKNKTAREMPKREKNISGR